MHARKASAGGKTLQNTHPFEQEVNGTRWFFCHNGTVRDELPIPNTLPKTDPTDSEQLFGLLLPYLAEREALAGFRAVYGGIRDFTSLNTFLLGPNELWAVSLYTENRTYHTLTLTKTEDGPVVSSEPFDEFAGDRAPIPSGTVVRIDRRTGRLVMSPLDCPEHR